jgi:hypothetical protein
MQTMLSEAEERFLDRARRRARLWPYAGTTLVALIVGFWGYLWIRQPLLANPLHLLRELERHAVAQSTLIVLAIVGSVMVIATGLLLLALVIVLCDAMASERRLIAMVDRLRQR